jgi:DNA-binding CsgD family transcriptional regulator
MPQVEALERLDSGDGVDAVLVYDVPGLPVHPLARGAHVATVLVEPQWVLMAARHPLAEQDEVTFDDVARYGLPWVVLPPGDRLRPWEESLILGHTPGAQLIDMGPHAHVMISQGRAVSLASPAVPIIPLLTLRPLAPVTTLHIYLTWQPRRVPATVAAELLTAVKGFVGLCAQRNPRFWRWIRDHPDDFPGLAPQPRHDPAATARAVPVLGPADGLTPREHEVLTLVAAGLDNAEIARELHLSPSTAKNHVMSIRTKLGARDRAQLVVLAHRHRLLG